MKDFFTVSGIMVGILIIFALGWFSGNEVGEQQTTKRLQTQCAMYGTGEFYSHQTGGFVYFTSQQIINKYKKKHHKKGHKHGHQD